MNTNTNLVASAEIKKTDDFYGKLIKTVLLLLVAVFPWVVLPSSVKPLESSRETLLFIVVGSLWIFMLVRFFMRREFEWRRTKLGWMFFVWIVLLGLIFLYSPDFKIAWRGYTGSLTGGLSEYLALLAFYFLATQFFDLMEWKKIIGFFATSMTLVLIFYIALTVYFENNGILTINFARTPSIVTAAVGVLALTLWWTVKRTEMVKKARSFVLFIILFFISSLLDFHIGWWMWVAGTVVILIFDFISRIQTYFREKEISQLGFSKEKKGLTTFILQGDAKYLSLILFFSLSRALSPLFLGEEKLSFMPFFSFLTQYPLLGQKVIFYLILNLLIFCLGIYFYRKLKKDRSEILLIISGLVTVSVAHLLYYSESTILLLLNWILIVYSGLTFLRKAPERDFLYMIKEKSSGKKVFVTLGVIFTIIILALFATFFI
ncbi:MAG: hypothetical protein V1690_00635 [Candidatus Moraniibacteriota bacterium]